MKRRLRRRGKITISIVLALLMILGMTFGNVPGPFNALKAQAVEGEGQGGPEIEGEGEGQGRSEGEGQGGQEGGQMSPEEQEAALIATLTRYVEKLATLTVAGNQKLSEIEKVFVYSDDKTPDDVGDAVLLKLEMGDEAVYIAREIQIQDNSTFMHDVEGNLVVFSGFSMAESAKFTGIEEDPAKSYIILFPMALPDGVFHVPNDHRIWVSVTESEEMMEFEYTSYEDWDPIDEKMIGDGSFGWVCFDGGEDPGQEEADVEAVFDVLYDVSEQGVEGGGEVSLIYGAEDEDGSLNVVEKGKNPPDPKPFGIKREFLQRQVTPTVTITPYEGFYIKEATYRIEDKEDPELKNQWTLVDPNDPLQTDPIEITLTQFDREGADGSLAVIHGEEDSFYLIVVFEAIPEEPEESLRIIVDDFGEGGVVNVYNDTTLLEGTVQEGFVEYTVPRKDVEDNKVVIRPVSDEDWSLAECYYPDGQSEAELTNGEIAVKLADFGEGDFVNCRPEFTQDVFSIVVDPFQTNYGSVELSPKYEFNPESGAGTYTFYVSEYKDVSMKITPKDKYQAGVTWLSGEEQFYSSAVELVIAENQKPEKDEALNLTVEFGISDEDMLNDIADTIYGYYPAGATTDDDIIAKLKEYLAKEIFGTFFAGKPADGDHPAEPGMYSGFADWKEVQAALSASNTAVQDSDLLVGLPFVDFTFGLPKAGKTIRVYVFENVGDIIVATQNKGTNDWTFTIATVSKTDGKGNDVTVLVPEYDGFPVVYGNGAQGIAGLQSDSTEIMTCHVTQEWSGHVQFPDSIINDEVIGNLNGRLIVVPMIAGSAAVRITGEEYCDGWDFGNITTFLAYETRGKASDALIYIKNNKVTVSSVAFGNKNPAVDAANAPTVTGVALDEQSGLPEGVITVAKSGENFVVAFNTNYDVIPIKITMSNGKTVFITLHRVAIRLEQKADDGKPTVSATYYYPTGKSKPGDSDQVTLFVMITTSSGKIVKELKSGSGTMLDSLDPDTDNPHYNAHGEKFLVWSENDCSYGSVVSVEVIAYKPGNSTRFDGVMAGSGKGVKWQKAQLQ